MGKRSKEDQMIFLAIVGLAGWALPGAGYYLLNEKKRAIIISTTVILTFLIGIYIGSMGVIDPITSKGWYAAQILVSPVVMVIGHYTAGGGYPVYGKPNEIGQIYTSIAGLLNLLCIVNAVYMAHCRRVNTAGG